MSGVGLPTGWVAARVGDIVTLENGRAFKKTEWEESGRPIIRIQNLNDADAPFNRHGGVLPEQFSVQDGDLLFAWSGTPGTSFGAHIWRRGPAWLNQHIYRVDFPREALVPEFLHLAVNRNIAEYIRDAHGGAGLAHITKKRFEGSTLLLAPLPEQHRIVAKIEELFSELDAGIAALERVQAKLERYRASVLKAAVEGKLTEQWRKENPPEETGEELLQRILAERKRRWEEEQLATFETKAREPPKNWKDKYKEPVAPDTSGLPELPEGWCYSGILPFLQPVAGMRTGPFGTALGKGDHRPAGIPVMGIENIGRRQFVHGSKIHVSASKAAELTAYSAVEGDLLISRSGTVGEVCVVPAALGEALFSTNVVRARFLSPNVLSDYFALLILGSPLVLRQIQEFCKGSTRTFLNQGILSSIVFPLPPSDEQERILAVVDQRSAEVDAVEAVAVSSLRRTSFLRQSILKRAFEGRLVPQDPNDEPASVLLDRIRAEREAAGPKSRRTKGRKDVDFSL